jgi:hypothetical protein
LTPTSSACGRSAATRARSRRAAREEGLAEGWHAWAARRRAARVARACACAACGVGAQIRPGNGRACKREEEEGPPLACCRVSSLTVASHLMDITLHAFMQDASRD